MISVLLALRVSWGLAATATRGSLETVITRLHPRHAEVAPLILISLLLLLVLLPVVVLTCKDTWIGGFLLAIHAAF